ncbi:MAG TPA: hypothetical protein VHG08_23305 [Longimicrobium sp.]|nr:hypothetical protein [Longimicrobium sp.]
MTQDGQEACLRAIRKALSSERLDAYGIGRSDDEKLANYFWNLALCESLYPSLHGLEVALRNALFDAGRALFPGLATRDVHCWLDADPPVILIDERTAVDLAKRRLLDRRKPLEPGRLVAELSFGFWTALFDVRYEQSRILWPRLFSARLLDAGCPRSMRSRKALSPLLNRIRHLRNRVFHHEPIWHWNDLAQQHQLALEMIGWFSPALRATIEPNDRFASIHAAGAAPFHEHVRSFLMMPR